jgi:thioredoxin
MPGPVEITSVTEWNTILRAARAAGRAVIVDFHAQWCGPCKQIAPMYSALATDANNAHGADFLRVDVDGPGTRVIAQKYQITAMPTFLVIRDGQVVDMVRGADPRGLQAAVKKHAVLLLAPDAEKAKAEGNKAFTAGDYESAITHYTTALEHAPQSAVLHANRSISYLKLAAQRQPSGSKDGEDNLRPKALQDAVKATELDERWAKGWVRMAEALLASEEDSESVAPELRAEGRRKLFEGAEASLHKAVGLATEGKVKLEAQKMLEDVQARLKAL